MLRRAHILRPEFRGCQFRSPAEQCEGRRCRRPKPAGKSDFSPASCCATPTGRVIAEMALEEVALADAVENKARYPAAECPKQILFAIRQALRHLGASRTPTFTMALVGCLRRIGGGTFAGEE